MFESNIRPHVEKAVRCLLDRFDSNHLDYDKIKLLRIHNESWVTVSIKAEIHPIYKVAFRLYGHFWRPNRTIETSIFHYPVLDNHSMETFIEQIIDAISDRIQTHLLEFIQACSTVGVEKQYLNQYLLDHIAQEIMES
jgi:hypothetical protein